MFFPEAGGYKSKCIVFKDLAAKWTL